MSFETTDPTDQRRSSILSARPAGEPAAALYRQLKSFVEEHIAAGKWQAGDRVPSEQQLVERFGVSRMTVNRALRELAQEGLVVRHAGLGTFVAKRKVQSTLLRIANIADEIEARGHAYRCDIVSVGREAAPAEVAFALGLDAGASVFHAVCVHNEDGQPVQLEDRYVSPAAAPDFLAQDFNAITPAQYLLDHVPYDQVEHVVDAILPTPGQAALLSMAPGEPCLMLTRRTWTRRLPVTFVRCMHPGSRYRLGSRFETQPGGFA